MLRIVDHRDVRELVMSSAASRLVGFKVSAYRYRETLVDTGFPRARREMARWLDTNPVAGVVVTHWHEDHAGNVPLVVERGIPLAMTAATEARVKAAEPVALYRRLVWGNPVSFRGRPSPADHPFELVPTPGHSDDHVTVWDPDGHIAFTGDLWLGVRASVVHDSEDPIAMVASLRKVLALEPALVFDSHRGLIADPGKAFGAKIEWLENAIGTIRLQADRGRPAATIARDVLGPEDATTFVSRGEMSKLNFVRAVLRGSPA